MQTDFAYACKICLLVAEPSGSNETMTASVSLPERKVVSERKVVPGTGIEPVTRGFSIRAITGVKLAKGGE